jgi:RNA polymerase sigma-70 factor, ECF subfamily
MRRTDPLRDLEPLIRRVYAYAAYRLGDGPDAEDATSETFERALRYRSSYDARKGAPAAWLIGIARRCVDESLAGRVTAASESPERADPVDVEAEAALRLDLGKALTALDDRSRELIALRYGADLTARQIAELLGERTNTVEVALHRTLTLLRGVLGPERPGPGGGERTAGGEEPVST